jgi:hypothetical protein
MPVKNAKGIRNDNGKKRDDQDDQYKVFHILIFYVNN